VVLVPKLYDFQTVAVQQILGNERLVMQQRGVPETSALIGDDMGLGKTVEAIALDLNRRRMWQVDYTAKTLVVTMTSVMGAWKKHYNDWAPWLKVVVVDRKDRTAFTRALKDPTVQVLICHWQGLRFMADELKEVEWFQIIGDEIQSIKNRKAQQTQVFKKLRTKYKLGLSGTWADNRPDDAWSVLNWLWPKVYTSYWGFFNHHVLQKKHTVGTCDAEGCDKYHQRPFTEITGMHDAELIHRQMGWAYVRRTKEEVWKDIPDKTYEDRMVELDPKQRRTYNAMAEDMLAWVGAHEDQPIAAPAVISQLVRLQQFAVAFGKMQTATVNKRYTEDELRRREILGKPFQRTYPMEVTQLVLDEPSSKLDAVMDIIGATNAQIVVFGQSKQAINLLATRLQRAGISHGVLTGDTKQEDRDDYIAEFQAGRRRIFCSTIKAGGVGITLTAATICIFLDRDWSPSKNKQAEDRLHRLGQKNAVLIITLVAVNTIDRERNAKVELKWSWLKKVLDPKQRTGA
jgi:SNF2 family DNA or RNA helicase